MQLSEKLFDFQQTELANYFNHEIPKQGRLKKVDELIKFLQMVRDGILYEGVDFEDSPEEGKAAGGATRDLESMGGVK